jgi:hypothetical protein
MNMKTLLGTAAGLMVASSAYAADLPGEAAPVAVDYVKVCDAYGKGFFYIPGTDTCLKLSGRVRSRVVYTDGGSISSTTGKDTDTVTLKTDAHVQFDARSESDLGTVRSFFGIKLDKGNIVADDAFIQVGYLTVGKMGFNSDVFYGDTAAIYGVFDQSSTGIQLMVDDLGGGFYVGAAVQSSDTTVSKWNPTVWTTGSSAELLYSGRVGIKGQSWGAFDVSALYQTFDDKNTAYHDTFAVRATADLKLIDKLSTRLTGAYVDYDIDSYASIAGALKYQATDALAVYAGVAGSFWDKSNDTINAQIGADYAFSKGLILTAEVNYLTDGGQNLNNKTSYYGNTDDSWSAMLKLTRNW